MKTFEQLGVSIPEIILPESLDTSTWSVVACDQYTQDRDYWKNVEKTAEGKPSCPLYPVLHWSRRTKIPNPAEYHSS